MKSLLVSEKVLAVLVLVLVVLTAVNVFLPQGSFLPAVPEGGSELPASKPVLALVSSAIVFVVYGLLGLIGLRLSKKLGFADIVDPGVTNKERFITPIIVGVVLGVVLIVADLLFSQFNNVGRFPHPPFPTSIFASLSAGIGEEIIFRLFFISFWVWLIAKVLLRSKYVDQVFWGVSALAAVAFAVGHFPSVMVLFGFNSIAQMPLMLAIELILLNGLVGLVCAYYFRKYGFLAAVGIHFWTDVVWHVIWGLVQ